MPLSSTAFSERSAIPQGFTCDGDDVSPLVGLCQR
jgi:hypothetical protein